MSTYLELCQDTCRECDIAGGDTVPTAVASQSGELQRIVKWVAQAYVEIQGKYPSWRWMRREFTLDTVASQRAYTFADAIDVIDTVAISRFRRWIIEDVNDPPRLYLVSAGVGGETWLTFTPWSWFKRIYNIGNNRTVEGFPAHITVDHQNNLVLGQIPNGIYRMTGDYYAAAQVLAVDADIPEMPAQFHQLIVYRAMHKYGLFESAPEVIEYAKTEGNKLMRALEQDQLQRIELARPLA